MCDTCINSLLLSNMQRTDDLPEQAYCLCLGFVTPKTRDLRFHISLEFVQVGVVKMY